MNKRGCQYIDRHSAYYKVMYRQTYNISRNLVDNKIVDHLEHRLSALSWSIACQRCSISILILDLTPGFNILHKDNCKTRNIQVLGFGATYIGNLTVCVLGIFRRYQLFRLRFRWWEYITQHGQWDLANGNTSCFHATMTRYTKERRGRALYGGLADSMVTL